MKATLMQCEPTDKVPIGSISTFLHSFFAAGREPRRGRADGEHVVERLVRRKPVEGVLVEALRPEAHLAATQVFCKNKLLSSVSFSIMRFVFYLPL